MLLPTRLWITRVELFLTPLRDELIFEIREAAWRWKDPDYQAIDEAARIEMIYCLGSALWFAEYLRSKPSGNRYNQGRLGSGATTL